MHLAALAMPEMAGSEGASHFMSRVTALPTPLLRRMATVIGRCCTWPSKYSACVRACTLACYYGLCGVPGHHMPCPCTCMLCCWHTRPPACSCTSLAEPTA